MGFVKKNQIIGVSATKSLEMARSFRYGLSEEFLRIGQKTVGLGVDSIPPPPPPCPYRVNRPQLDLIRQLTIKLAPILFLNFFVTYVSDG